MVGFPRFAEVDPQSVAPHLTVKKSVTESVFCVWVMTKSFFPAAWLFEACSALLDSEKAFAHNFSFAFVLPSGADINQALY